MSDKPKVLFLCTGNSCRSQMAEALLRHHAAERFEACSAGTEPTSIHPMTLQVLEEAGVDTTGLRSKPTTEFLGRVSIHHAIFVCDKAQQACPYIFPFALHSLYWPFDDPAGFEGTPEGRLEKFRVVRDQIRAHIQTWLAGTALTQSRSARHSRIS